MTLFARHEYPGETLGNELGDRTMAYLESENYSIWPLRREHALVDRIWEDAEDLYSDGPEGRVA